MSHACTGVRGTSRATGNARFSPRILFIGFRFGPPFAIWTLHMTLSIGFGFGLAWGFFLSFFFFFFFWKVVGRSEFHYLELWRVVSKFYFYFVLFLFFFRSAAHRALFLPPQVVAVYDCAGDSYLLSSTSFRQIHLSTLPPPCFLLPRWACFSTRRL